MKNTKNRDNPNQDDQLADFTDRILADKSDQADPEANEELRRLEETILRLKRAIPPAQLDAASIRQMQARLNARLKQESLQKEPSFWQNLFGRNLSRLFFTLPAVVILALAILAAPFLTVNGSSIAATATIPPQSAMLIIVPAGTIIVILWIKYRR